MQPLYSVLDHLVYATPDLNSTVDRIEALFGVRAVVGGHHKAWRTKNALLSLGTRMYLEIMGPDEPARAPNQPRPFDLDDLVTPRLVTWVARSADMQTVIVTARRHGVNLGELQERSRQKPDGSVLKWTMTDLTKPREGGVIPYFINWGTSAHPAETSPESCKLLSVKLSHPDPGRIGQILGHLGIEAAVDFGPKASLEALIETPQGQFKLV
jgi:hypothetical protein